MSHPVHPALVHFPIVCWSLGSFVDIVSWGIEPSLSILMIQYSNWLVITGLLLAMPAMLAGMVDLSKITNNKEAKKVVAKHMTFVGSAWCLYSFMVFIRYQQDIITSTSLLVTVISIVSFSSLAVAGWLGAKLVYELGVGVQRKV